MRIGFDLAQAYSLRAGCGWYAQSLLRAMTEVESPHHFIGYRHFGRWLNHQSPQTPLAGLMRVQEPQSGISPDLIVQQWDDALATGEFPGQPDLVHSTSFQAPRMTQTPLVVTVFDLSFWAAPDFTTDGIRLDCQRGILDAIEHADGLIFISEHARREFERFLPLYRRRGKIASVVTPLASRWPVVARPDERPGSYWLFVGSQEPRKNIAGLLDAYEAYADQHSRPRPLWLAGGTGWKNQSWQGRLKRLEERHLLRRLGYVPDEELPDLYRNAIALLFPSWYEGFGLPVLEAMTQGCAVICSDRTSLPEVGGDAVEYIDPAKPETIKLAMQRLEQDPLHRRELIRRGLARATRFSWTQTAKQTLAFYDRIHSGT